MFHSLESKTFAAILLISFSAMSLMLFLLLTGDLKIPQKETLQPVNIKNRVNICLPEEDEISL
jgi:hypothetical protein